MSNFAILVVVLAIGVILTLVVNKVKKTNSNKLEAIIWMLIVIVFACLWYFKR